MRRIVTAREQVEMLSPWLHKTAAVNQDMVDRLNKEFHQWVTDNPHKVNPARDWGRGAIGNWDNVEGFLGDHYPAANKNVEFGQEDAGYLLDGHDPSELQDYFGDDNITYESGQDAVAKHGYDPSEIAASMLLLHNKSHPFRGDLAQDDQDRLNTIFQNRQQMQQNYRKRQLKPEQESVGWRDSFREDYDGEDEDY